MVPETTGTCKSFRDHCTPRVHSAFRCSGDGLVAARHLKHFGYEPVILYPKRATKGDAVRLYSVSTGPACCAVGSVTVRLSLHAESSVTVRGLGYPILARHALAVRSVWRTAPCCCCWLLSQIVVVTPHRTVTRSSYDAILDAVFGFRCVRCSSIVSVVLWLCVMFRSRPCNHYDPLPRSFSGEVRAPFDAVLPVMVEASRAGVPTVSVDIPSGWHVENGTFLPVNPPWFCCMSLHSEGLSMFSCQVMNLEQG